MDEEDKSYWPLLQAWAVIREDPKIKLLLEKFRSAMARSSKVIIACPLHEERLHMLAEQVDRMTGPDDAAALVDVDLDLIDETTACLECRLLVALVADDPRLLRDDLGDTPEEVAQRARECFKDYQKKYGGGGSQ